MSRNTNGRKGFDVTTAKYFGGDSEKHVKWLGDYGSFVYARMMFPYAWWKIKAGAFRHPGPHPAWTEEESKICEGCNIPMRDCLCHKYNEIPF